jgi:hypothetical protein
VEELLATAADVDGDGRAALAGAERLALLGVLGTQALVE